VINLSTKKDPEFKQMIGQRLKDSDGFTYEYGQCKGGYKNGQKFKELINRCRRNDKRSVRLKSMKRILKEME
jgi:hypothetical protein